MKHVDPVKLLRNRCTAEDQKTVAAALGVAPGYLSDLLNGRREPGPKVLAAMGLRREIRYYPIQPRVLYGANMFPRSAVRAK